MAQKKKKSITYTVYVDAKGTRTWCVGGACHREDGPAVEYAFGDKEWFFNNKLHRVGGPAVENSNGYKEWWFKGKRHREDGPAIEYANGNKNWYIAGKQLSEEEFLKRTKKKPLKKKPCNDVIVVFYEKKYKLTPV